MTEKTSTLLGYLAMLVIAVGTGVSMVAFHPFAPFIVLIGGAMIAVIAQNAFTLMLTFIIFALLRLPDFMPILGQFSIGKLIISGALGTLIASRILHGQFRFVSSPHNLWLFLLTIAIIISSLLGSDPTYSFDTFTEVFLKIAILWIVFINTVTDEKRSMTYQVTISLITVLLGMYAITAQILGYDPVSGAQLVEGTRAGLQGALGDPNDLAMLLLMGMPFAAIATLDSSGKQRYLFGACLVAIIGGILSTQSRGGLLGLATGFGLILYDRIKSKSLTVMLSVGFLMAMAVLAGISERSSGGSMSGGLDDSASGRLDAWSAGIRIFGHNPFFGVGFNCFRFHFFQHEIHNSFLKVLVETGLMGFIPFAVLFWLSLRGILRIRKTAHPDRASRTLVDAMKLCALPTIGAVSVSAFFLNHAWTWFLYMIFMHSAVNNNIFNVTGDEDTS
ncbi:MAG: O-antigen ligase family protein [Myxococcota bacterium]|nr:O-antigen ligase family protein [Myxococcota bacterium]